MPPAGAGGVKMRAFHGPGRSSLKERRRGIFLLPVLTIPPLEGSEGGHPMVSSRGYNGTSPHHSLQYSGPSSIPFDGSCGNSYSVPPSPTRSCSFSPLPASSPSASSSRLSLSTLTKVYAALRSPISLPSANHSNPSSSSANPPKKFPLWRTPTPTRRAPTPTPSRRASTPTRTPSTPSGVTRRSFSTSRVDWSNSHWSFGGCTDGDLSPKILLHRLQSYRVRANLSVSCNN